jgi:hypothetical protein
MGIKSNIVDLASHFPPSNYLGKAAKTKSGLRKNGDASHFDGVIVFPHEDEILAHWELREIYQQRTGWDSTRYVSQCEILGFAQMKGALRAQVTEPVFFETWRDGNSVVSDVFRLFKDEHASFNFTVDAINGRGLSIVTEAMRVFVPEHLSRELIAACVVTPPSLLPPYATVCVGNDELNQIRKVLLNCSHESSFSLLNGELQLHGRAWNSPKSVGCSFGRVGGRNTVNALTMFEKFFEEIDIGDPEESPALTSKQREAQKRAENIAASTEEARRMSLSVRDLAIEDFKTLQKPVESSPYALVSSRRLRSFVNDSGQFYVPSQDRADWFPSRVLSAALDGRGVTTIHLRPRMVEVVKETPFAVYRYFICGRGIWQWYQNRQPARYFAGKFEYA